MEACFLSSNSFTKTIEVLPSIRGRITRKNPNQYQCRKSGNPFSVACKFAICFFDFCMLFFLEIIETKTQRVGNTIQLFWEMNSLMNSVIEVNLAFLSYKFVVGVPIDQVIPVVDPRIHLRQSAVQYMEKKFSTVPALVAVIARQLLTPPLLIRPHFEIISFIHWMGRCVASIRSIQIGTTYQALMTIHLELLPIPINMI